MSNEQPDLGSAQTTTQATRILSNIRGTQLEVNIVLRQQRRSIGELLKLSPGTVMTFAGPASNTGTLSINGQTLANGKVVQCGENYALQIEELVAAE